LKSSKTDKTKITSVLFAENGAEWGRKGEKQNNICEPFGIGSQLQTSNEDHGSQFVKFGHVLF